MIHLVFGRAATGSLKFALPEEGHEIIGFPIDFSIGPITNIHQKDGVGNYFTWMKSSFHPMWSEPETDHSDYQQALQKVAEIKKGNQLTIWTCDNATEQIGLRISCYVLEGKDVELNVVNTFQAMYNYTKRKDAEIRRTGECNGKQLAYFYQSSLYPISKETRETLEQEGERLIQSKSLVRSWKHGKIVHELETRDDSFIMNCARRMHQEMDPSGFIKAVRVMGEVIAYSEQPLPDAWVEYRIRSLIHSGYLLYEGDLQSMRMYDIKVVS